MEIKTTNVYNRIKDVDARIVLLRGGTRSSKSFSMMQIALIWLMTGNIGGRQVDTGVFSIVRSTLPALKATVYRDLVNYLHELGIYRYINHVRTTLEFHYEGRQIVFFSLDDSHKLRGRQHSFLWYNEVNDINFETWNQGAFRTTHTIYNDYNPSGRPFIRTEIEEKRMHNYMQRGLTESDVHLDVSVYTDNPFLPELLIKEIEGLEFVDNDLWRIYTKGEWVSLKGLIYKDVVTIDEMPTEGKTYWGLDFGYNDPNVLIKAKIIGNNLYVDCKVYQTEMLIDEMATAIKEFVMPHERVYCDSAEPRTIEELKRRGLLAKPAKKGADSIRQGLTFIKQHNIFLTSASVETAKEWSMFKWAEDKEGHLTDKPISMYDHSSDALRYALNKALGTKLRFI